MRLDPRPVRTPPPRRPTESLRRRRGWVFAVAAAAVVGGRTFLPTVVTAAQFEPYTLNGGLVCAVAGRDFVVVATDTRLIANAGDYRILERCHVRSRLWAATGSSSSTTHVSVSETLVAPDGSLAVDLANELVSASRTETASTVPKAEEEEEEVDEKYSLRLLRQSVDSVPPPVWIGSAGCQADCEQLKRLVRADVRAASYFGELTEPSTPPDAIAILLSHVLYSRRNFPFYSFCVVAGLSNDGGNGGGGVGQVYGYDAIGSYEQMAVACVGTGMDLMQPILDRKFQAVQRVNDVPSSSSSSEKVLWTPRTVHNIPVPRVDCETPEEAVQILLAAYRSVSEREIQVGDNVVFYTVQRMLATAADHKDGRNGGVTSQKLFRSKIWTAPLKKH